MEKFLFPKKNPREKMKTPGLLVPCSHFVQVCRAAFAGTLIGVMASSMPAKAADISGERGEAAQVVEKDFVEILKDLEINKNEPWAKEALDELTYKNPDLMLRWLVNDPNFSDKAHYEILTMRAARNAATLDPAAFFLNADRLKGKPYFEELMKIAAENASLVDPAALLNFVPLVRWYAWSDEPIIKAINQAPWAALVFANKVGEHIMGEEFIQMAASLDLGSAIRYAPKIRTFSCASKIFLEAAQQYPIETLRQFIELKSEMAGEYYYPEIIKAAIHEALKKDPDGLRELRKKPPSQAATWLSK